MTVMTTAEDTGAADIDAAMKAGDHAALVSALVRTAREAQAVLGMSSFDQRKAALHAAAGLIRKHEAAILARNEADVARAGANGISPAFIDRRPLPPARIARPAAGRARELEGGRQDEGRATRIGHAAWLGGQGAGSAGAARHRSSASARASCTPSATSSMWTLAAGTCTTTSSTA